MIQPSQTGSELIDLREFFDILRRRKWTVLLTTAFVVLSALAFVYLRAPVYTSHAEVEVQPSDSDELLRDISMDTEATKVTQQQIAALAAPAMGLDPHSPAQLDKAAEDVTVVVPPNTTFLNISCTAVDPARAQTCASAFAKGYVDDRVSGARDRYNRAMTDIEGKIRLANQQLHYLEGLTADTVAERKTIHSEIESQSQSILAAQALAFGLPSPSPTAAVVSRSADLPGGPANKSFVLTGLLATLLGLVLGIALSLVQERLDTRIGDRAGLEDALAAPLMATVPDAGGRPHARDAELITRDDPQSLAAEAYRTVRPTLLYLAKKDSVKIVTITGVGETEGEGTTVANLAVSLATGGEKVLVICCDLRKPRLHLFFQRPDESGLSDVLNGKLAWRDVLQETDVDGLSIIASGPVPDNPAELLGNDEMRVLLADLRKEFDLILLDTPPALVVADAVTLTPNTDGVLVVAHAGKTPRTTITHLRDQIGRVGGHVIGGILYEPPRVPWRLRFAALRGHVTAGRGSSSGADDHQVLSPSQESLSMGDGTTSD